MVRLVLGLRIFWKKGIQRFEVEIDISISPSQNEKLDVLDVIKFRSL